MLGISVKILESDIKNNLWFIDIYLHVTTASSGL